MQPEQNVNQAQDSKLALFSVFDLVSNFCNDIVSSAQSFISSTWTFYLQADDGKVMVFQVVLREKLERPLLKEPKSKANIQPPAETQTPPEHDFLGCMSKRSGLPRWILAACLFLSIVVMLWLSCASLVTAPEQHVKTQPLSINGDKEFLEDLDNRMPYSLHPVIAVTICPADENEEASLLPVKVDLDKTAL
ncbi:hypothetical protein JD844_034032 [Phrynosoma platyrhinos]|uniref:Transmembrane protein 59-like n=1 Tax=Phrynosoma platyrhinos TaxID=52577 RepID=A0ABQ7T7U3_PHRPL|nr:hypothetical protein JD844_034032 [Phrynosoma platyrhinos]